MSLGYPQTIVSPKRKSLSARATGRESILRRLDWVLLLCALTLSIGGAIFVFSATRVVSAGEDPQAFLKRHLLNLAIGLVLGTATMLFDYRTLRAYAPFVYIISVLGLIAVLSPVGSSVNGAHAWILLPGGFSVQPSEFMKVALVVGLAMLLSERRDAETEPQFRDVAWALLVAAIPLGLVMLQPDLGTAVVMGMIVLGILAVAGMRLSWLAGLIAAGALGAFVAVKVGVLDQYQIDRLLAFANPNLDPQGVGYNTNQARITIGSGQLTGTGLFDGSQTNGQFVPEQETDFIFTVPGEQLGFIGSALIIVLFAVLLWRAGRIAMRAEDLFGTLVATGILCWFTFQMFENIGMVTGIMPVTGVPLPFVSYGGSSMFANWMAIGLLENVHLRRALR
ncbi:MAG TPA: rod shape-determining protein RodA [Actinomycetes bacterium]|nr:rod shape-determining protein RodA [Actinomycetes bacterium]